MKTGLTRKERINQQITESAIKMFSRQGIRHTSLDEIAKEADVARRTLYNHFTSKEDIIVNITKPILSTAFELLSDLPRECTPETLFRFCYKLWESHKNDLNIIYLLELKDIGPLKPLLEEFNSQFIQLFYNCNEQHTFYQSHPHKTALLVFKVFLPVLQSLDEEENREEKFIKMMKGLIFSN